MLCVGFAGIITGQVTDAEVVYDSSVSGLTPEKIVSEIEDVCRLKRERAPLLRLTTT
jgi:hypothetical protein